LPWQHYAAAAAATTISIFCLISLVFLGHCSTQIAEQQ